MSKECGHHSEQRSTLIRRVYGGVLIFLFLVLLTVLLIWAILQPSKPSFVIQDATLFLFNLSAPNLLSSTIQVTLSSRNPNDHIGVYYDALAVSAVYHSQQITLRTSIPPSYQPHNDLSLWSPFLLGTDVPIAPYNGASLSRDRDLGTLALAVRLDGRVRFRVGYFVSARYHIHVNCPATIVFGNPSAGVVLANNAVKYQLVRPCDVSL